MAGWVKIPQDVWCHPRYTTLPAEVLVLYLKTWAYCAANGTDGVVPRAYLAAIHPTALPDAAAQLVAAGLFQLFGDSEEFTVVGFLDLNLSAAQRANVTDAQRTRANKRWSDAVGMPAASVRHAAGMPAVQNGHEAKLPVTAKGRKKPPAAYVARPHMDAMSDEELGKLSQHQLVWEYFRMLFFAAHRRDPTPEVKHWTRLAALLRAHAAPVVLRAVELVFYAAAPLPWPLNTGPVTIDRFLQHFDLLVEQDAVDGGGEAVKHRIETDGRIALAKTRLQDRLTALHAQQTQLLPEDPMP